MRTRSKQGRSKGPKQAPKQAPKRGAPRPQKQSNNKERGGAQYSKADWPDLVYGKNPVYEALNSKKRKVYEILTAQNEADLKNEPWFKLAKQHQVQTQQTDQRQLDFLSDGGVHQGVVARVQKYQKGILSDIIKDTSESNLVLALDCVQDPHNFGAVCRSAMSFGVKHVLIPQDRSAPLTGTTFKSSAGALEHLNIVEVTNLVRALKELKESDYWIYGASLSDSSVELQKVSPAKKSVLVLGSEGKGIRRLVEETCDQLVKIEMAGGFDSLNVAQAGSVLLYQFWQKGDK